MKSKSSSHPNSRTGTAVGRSHHLVFIIAVIKQLLPTSIRGEVNERAGEGLAVILLAFLRDEVRLNLRFASPTPSSR